LRWLFDCDEHVERDAPNKKGYKPLMVQKNKERSNVAVQKCISMVTEPKRTNVKNQRHRQEKGTTGSGSNNIAPVFLFTLFVLC
jgi:hypothetical protein